MPARTLLWLAGVLTGIARWVSLLLLLAVLTLWLRSLHAADVWVVQTLRRDAGGTFVRTYRLVTGDGGVAIHAGWERASRKKAMSRPAAESAFFRYERTPGGAYPHLSAYSGPADYSPTSTTRPGRPAASRCSCPFGRRP